MLQFTTRRLLFVSTLFAIEAAAIGRGWLLNDRPGAIAAGVFMLPGLMILTLLVYRWSKERLISRIFAVPVLLLFLLPFFLELKPGEEATNRRLAAKIQAELKQHPGFRDVHLRYMPRTSQRKSIDWIQTSGTVADSGDLDALRRLINSRTTVSLQIQTFVEKKN
jgi:hypothetical protein